MTAASSSKMNETAHTDLIAEAITEAFGERCPDYAEGCPCCDAWKQYDDMLAALKLAEPILGNGPVTLETIAAYKAVADAIAIANGMPRAAIAVATPPEGI